MVRPPKKSGKPRPAAGLAREGRPSGTPSEARQGQPPAAPDGAPSRSEPRSGDSVSEKEFGEARQGQPSSSPSSEPRSGDGVSENNGFAEAPQPALEGQPVAGSVSAWLDDIVSDDRATGDAPAPVARSKRGADIPGRAPETGRRALDQSLPLTPQNDMPASRVRKPDLDEMTVGRTEKPLPPDAKTPPKRKPKTGKSKPKAAKDAPPKTANLRTARGTSMGGPGTAKERAGAGLMPVAGMDVTLEEAGNLPESGVTATVEALSKLIEEGRDEFQQGLWVPHRPERPAKSEGGVSFAFVSEFEPKGDQPQAIVELVAGLRGTSAPEAVANADTGEDLQVLLGVTGSGKTFTMAKVIEETQRPALILAPNKTLAAQLYGEFKSFFPDNAVEYFVSYYDYYQPEAYVPRTDTFIEKESSINEQIDRMRHSATRSLLERDDVIIVASVSCIYGIGSVETYTAMTFAIEVGDRIDQRQLLADLVALQYRRSDANFFRGTFRVRGDTVEIFPAHLEDRAWRVSLFGDEVESITEFDPLTGQKAGALKSVKVYANSHYVTPKPTLQQAVKSIRSELKWRLEELTKAGRLLEAQRLEQRCTFDMEMMEATGSCAGIENYSRYLTGRQPGEPPPTLFEYLPDNALVFVDESHVTIPQLGAMYKGDFRRKATLAEFGFRLPSCMDNRPPSTRSTICSAR